MSQVADDLKQQLHGMWSAVAPAWAEHAAYADERGADVAERMLELTAVGPGDRVLELACGPGGLGLAAAARGADVVLSDLSAEMTAIAAARAGALHTVSTRVLDVDDIDQPDEAYDVVLCREGLMFATDPHRAADGLRRVLRPGGRIAVTVPTRWPERVCWALDYHYHDTPGGHIRIYRQPQLEAKLERAGLALRGSHHAHSLHSPYWWLKCVVGVENADAWAVRRYHDFLVWDITKRPALTRVLDRALNPVLGKSLVVYAEKV
jgi:SAM-dependent methyltransferase